VERRFGDRLMREATDPTTGRFDPVRFTRELDRYPPETLNALLADGAQEINRLRARFQAAARGAQSGRQSDPAPQQEKDSEAAHHRTSEG
jgi:hypothetical protein